MDPFNFKENCSKTKQMFQKKNKKYDNHQGYDGKTLERKFNREWGTVRIKRENSFGYDPSEGNFVSYNWNTGDSTNSKKWEYYSSTREFTSESDNTQGDHAKWKDASKEFSYYCFCTKGGGSRHGEGVKCQEKNV